MSPWQHEYRPWIRKVAVYVLRELGLMMIIVGRHPAAQLAMLSQIPQKMELVVGTVQAEKHVYGSAGAPTVVLWLCSRNSDLRY